MKRERAERSRVESKKKAGRKEEDPELAKVEQKVQNIDFMLDIHRCEICNREIGKTVMILCARCGVLLCMNCLAAGQEKGDHRRTDSYYVLNSLTHPVYSQDWTAREELMLVKGILM